MASLIKRGAQNPYIQMLLGGLSQFVQDTKKERETQNEYARKVALMDRERLYQQQDRSMEQATADTRLKETRAYNEGQTQETRRYNEQQAAAKTAQDQQTAQTKDQTDFQQAMLRGITERLASLADKPEEAVTYLKSVQPNLDGKIDFDFQYAIATFGEAAKTQKAGHTSLDKGYGILRRGPSADQTVPEWYIEAMESIKGAVSTKDYDDFQTTAGKAVTAMSQAATQEAKPTPGEQITRDVTTRLYSDADVPIEVAGQRILATQAATGTLKTGADSTAAMEAGYLPKPKIEGFGTDLPEPHGLTPDQTSALRAGAGGAAPQTQSVFPDAGGPAVPPAGAQSQVEAMGAGPRSMQAAQRAVSIGKARSVGEALQMMKAAGIDTSL